MRVRVVSDIERFTRGMDEAATRHVPFAIARALTWTARDAQKAVREELPQRFTLRNAWVSKGIRMDLTRKHQREVLVGSVDWFMKRQETGGRKTSRKGKYVAIPMHARPNKSKVIPKRLRPEALRGRKKVLIHKGSNIIRSNGRDAIFERVGKDRYPIQVLYWMKKGVQVKPRFGFEGTTRKVVAERFGPNFVASLSDAMGHLG